MKICNKCGRMWDTENRFCTECGGTLSDAAQGGEKMPCPNCGQPINRGVSFCTKCGSRLNQAQPPQPPVQQPPRTAEPPQPQESKSKVGIIVTIAVLSTVLILVIVLILCFGSGSCGGSGDGEQISQERVYHWDGDYLKDQDGIVILHITDIANRPGTYVDDQGRLRDADGMILMEADKYQQYLADNKKESTYRFVKSDANWYDARSGAYQNGGYLLSVNDYEEFQKACQMAEDAGVIAFWIGASRSSYQSWYDIKWEDGQDFSYTKWLAGEPSGTTEDGDEELYLMVFKVQGEWYYNDAPGDISEYYSGRMGYIVEIEE